MMMTSLNLCVLGNYVDENDHKSDDDGMPKLECLSVFNDDGMMIKLECLSVFDDDGMPKFVCLRQLYILMRTIIKVMMMSTQIKVFKATMLH